MDEDLHSDASRSEADTSGQRRTEPDEHRIRLRAYEIWEEEGKPDGRAEEHWMRARRELESAPDPNEEPLRLRVGMGPGSGAR